jgi:solute carrier family 25 protein 34/35
MPPPTGRRLAQTPGRSVVVECACGALATMGACCFSNPVDVLKSRLQVQGELARTPSRRPYGSLPRSLVRIVRAEGARALQKGLVPALSYNAVLNCVRFGAYERLTQASGARRDSRRARDAGKNLGAASLSGMLGGAVASPLAMVRTRMQISASSSATRVGTQHRTPGLLRGLQQIRAHGLRGLLAGAGPQALRVGCGTSAQFLVYDAAKARLLAAWPLVEGSAAPVHLLAASAAAVATSLAINPLDVVATRMYNQPAGAGEGGRRLYTGSLDCVLRTVRTEGVAGLYKGLAANVMRQLPHQIVTFVLLEQLRERLAPDPEPRRRRGVLSAGA